MSEINVFRIVKELLELETPTDSDDWPHRNQIIYQPTNKPDIWAKICLFAAALTENLILKIWFLIEFVNGWRRQIGKWDIELAINILEEIKNKIDGLPEKHPQKDRLLELYFYHSSYVYFPAGEFIKAAACNVEEAKIAAKASDKRGMMLARLNAAFQWLNAGIVANGNISSLYRQFEKSCQNFLKVLTTEAEEDLRWKANVYNSLMFYGWIVNRKKPDDQMLQYLIKLPNGLVEIFANVVLILRAIKELEDHPGEAISILNQVDKNATIDARTFSIVVEVQAYQRLNKPKAVEDSLRRIEHLTKKEHGGQVALAIIKHELI